MVWEVTGWALVPFIVAAVSSPRVFMPPRVAPHARYDKMATRRYASWGWFWSWYFTAFVCFGIAGFLVYYTPLPNEQLWVSGMTSWTTLLLFNSFAVPTVFWRNDPLVILLIIVYLFLIILTVHVAWVFFNYSLAAGFLMLPYVLFQFFAWFVSWDILRDDDSDVSYDRATVSDAVAL